uniref:Uncharacterized protein n=2 Tax=Caenorhabditis japonica TaxID=281687 RepID=A0A8R1IX83_CAEJA
MIKANIFFLFSEKEFLLLPLRVLCASCFSDNPEHEGHQQVKLKDLKGLAEQIKMLVSRIAGQFLWNEIKSTDNEDSIVKCKLRYMIMLRTCEVLIHLAKIHIPLLFPKELQSTNRYLTTHFRIFSKLSKYFEGLEWEDHLQPHPDLVSSLVESLKFQWNQYKTLKGLCECSEFWKEMSETHCCKNDLELNYVEMIMNTSLEENDKERGKCPIDFQTSIIQRGALKTLKAREVINFSELRDLLSCIIVSQMEDTLCLVGTTYTEGTVVYLVRRIRLLVIVIRTCRFRVSSAMSL